MLIDFNRLWKKITNPLLFYVDKSGNSIFKNYCIYKNDGCMYSKTFSIPEAGKVMEYRIKLNKKLRHITILISFIIYFVLVHTGLNIVSVLLCEFFWLATFFAIRTYFACLYKNKLISEFGNYKLVNFNPSISKKKQNSYYEHFASKIVSVLIVTFIFFIPAFISYGLIKINLNSKKPHYQAALRISNFYKLLYPQTIKYYEMNAYAKYMTQDYEGALKDYKKVLEMSGKRFSQKDYTRFANLLYLDKKVYGSQKAIEDFNDYATRKIMSVKQQSKILWMKSMFSISSQIYDYIDLDYEDLLSSLNKKDYKNKFYILCDKAYMYYLMGEYENAIKLYDKLIPYAQEHEDTFAKELRVLYVERGYAKRHSGNYIGADFDFNISGIDLYELEKYEPVLLEQNFIVQNF